MKNVYLVEMEQGNAVEVGNLTKVAGLLGVKKVTKADIEEGKYPMVSIMEATHEADKDQVTLGDIAEASEGHIEIIPVGDAPSNGDNNEPKLPEGLVEGAKIRVVHTDDTDLYEWLEDHPTGILTITEAEEESYLVWVEGCDYAISIDEIELVPEDEVPTDKEAANKQQVLDLISNAISATPESNVELFDALCELDDAVTDDVELTSKQADLLTLILTEQLDYNAPLTNTAPTDTHEEDTEEDNSSDTEYPEVGYFTDEKAMKKYVKALSDKSVEEWCLLEGVTWKACDHQAINRMRMIMALKVLHFPELAKKSGSKKSKSKYASYSTEELVQMALDNEVEVPDDKGDMRICRMYTIMALRKAGIIE